MYEPENEKSIDGNIIVSREINSNGKDWTAVNQWYVDGDKPFLIELERPYLLTEKKKIYDQIKEKYVNQIDTYSLKDHKIGKIEFQFYIYE